MGIASRKPAPLKFADVAAKVGGATAVLHGWRPTTIDIDLTLTPERDELLRALPELKCSLDINIELAAPQHSSLLCPGGKPGYPAIDSADFRSAVEEFVREAGAGSG